MSASTITTSRNRPARYGAFSVGLLLAGALLVPSGAHAAGTARTAAAKASQSGEHAVVAHVASKKRCRHGKRAVRRHGRWVCKRVVIKVAVPQPSAPQQPSQPQSPSVVDVTRQQAEAWARVSMAQGRSVDFRIDGCQPVNASRGFCHIDLILPGVALYERFLFNTYIGSVQLQNTYLFEGRFYL